MICKHILEIRFLTELELFFFTQLDVFKYFYLTATIKHQSFVCTQSWFYLIHTQDSIRCYHSRLLSRLGSNNNYGVLHIPQISNIPGALPLNCLLS